MSEDNGIIKRFEILEQFGVDLEERHLFLTSEINDESITALSYGLHMLLSQGSGPIRFTISSDGGDVLAAFHFYDQLVSNNVEVHTLGSGRVCSAAVLLLLAGDVRACTKNTFMMTHQVSAGIEGNESTLISGVQSTRMMSKRYWQILGRRTNQTAAWWREKSDKGEFWISADAMKKYGVVDLVAPTYDKRVAKKPRAKVTEPETE